MRTWRRRRDAALHSAVNAHVREGDFLAALARLDWLARRCPADAPDPTILSLAGRVHLVLGDVEGAEMCFSASAEAVERAMASASVTRRAPWTCRSRSRRRQRRPLPRAAASL